MANAAVIAGPSVAMMTMQAPDIINMADIGAAVPKEATKITNPAAIMTDPRTIFVMFMALPIPLSFEFSLLAFSLSCIEVLMALI